MTWLRGAAAVLAKDLRIELRSGEVLLVMVFFAVLVVLVITFALYRADAGMVEDVAAGSMWVAIAFAGTLGLSRAFQREREGGALQALLMAPIPRESIFLGKTAAIFVFMLVMELAMVPLVAVFFNVPVLRSPLNLAALVVLGSLGIAAVGAVFSAMLLRSRSREILLSVALYPIIMPLVIAGAKGTSLLFQTGGDFTEVAFWTKFLAVYDAVFITVSLWLFEPLVLE